MGTPVAPHPRPAPGGDPPVLAALLMALAIAGAVVVVNLVGGLLYAVLLPSEALVLQVLGSETGVLGHAAAVATSGVLGNVDALPADVVGAVAAPGFLALTIAASALTAAAMGRRAPELGLGLRVAAAAAAALPVLVAMLALGSLAGIRGADLSLWSIARGSVLLVPIGGIAGAVRGARRDARAAGVPAPRLLPDRASRAAATVVPALAGLGGLAIVATVVGVLNTLVTLLVTPVPDGVGTGRGINVLNLVLATPDVTIGSTSLTLMSESERAYFSLAPSTQAFFAAGGDPTSLPDGPFVLFGTLAWWVALPELLVLLAALLAAGVGAGAWAARRARARTTGERLLAGASVGLVWTLAVPTLAWMTDQQIDGAGRIVGPLLIGGVLGAAGALLSVLPRGRFAERAPVAAPEAAPAPSPWSARADRAPESWPPPAMPTPAPGPPERAPSLWGPGERERDERGDRPVG